MPAKSKRQQRFMGMIRSIQKGEFKPPSKKLKDVAKNMKKKDVEEFAKTKHKGLPEKVRKKKSKKRSNMINELIKLATHLDNKGLKKEANYIDAVIKKMAAKGRNRAWDPTKIHRDGKRGREKYTGEVSTFKPHPDRPGYLLGPGGQEISMAEMGIEQPKERPAPGSMLGYGGPSLGEELTPELTPELEESLVELEDLPPEAGEGLATLEEDLPSLEDEPLTTEERLASVESRLGKIEDDLYG